MERASIWKEPKQSPDNEHETFSELVKKLLEEHNLKAVELAAKSNLSKTTISRILRDSNDKGKAYRPTESIVTAIAIALKVGRGGWERLMDAAFPERLICFEVLDCGGSVYDANARLDEAGLPLLGNPKID